MNKEDLRYYVKLCSSEKSKPFEWDAIDGLFDTKRFKFANQLNSNYNKTDEKKDNKSRFLSAMKQTKMSFFMAYLENSPSGLDFLYKNPQSLSKIQEAFYNMIQNPDFAKLEKKSRESALELGISYIVEAVKYNINAFKPNKKGELREEDNEYLEWMGSVINNRRKSQTMER